MSGYSVYETMPKTETHVKFLLCLVFVIAIFLRSFSILHHDVAWFLYETEQYLGGAQLYIDIIEINPPLFLWILSPSVFFADILGVKPSIIYKTFIFVSAAISVFLCSKFIKRDQKKRAIVLLAIALSLTLFPGMDFGKRVHLMLIFGLPYICLVAARVRQDSVNLMLVFITAVLAVAVFMFKPHFLLIPASLELYLLTQIGLRKTVLRPEPYIFLACGLIYALSIWLFTPNYFSQIAGYAIEVYGAGYNQSFIYNAKALMLLIPVGIATFVWMIRNRSWRAEPLAIVFTLLVLDGLIIYFTQAKGWHYQALPICVGLILLVTVLILCGEDKSEGQSLQSFGVQLLLATCLIMMSPHLGTWKYATDKSDRFLDEIKPYPDTQSVMVMSSRFSEIYPFIYEADVKNASRLPNFWFAPGLLKKRALRGHSTPLLDEIETYNRDIATEDIIKNKPQIVFVDNRANKPYFGAQAYDYIEDFSQNPDFARAWSEYELVKEIYGFEIYLLNGPR